MNLEPQPKPIPADLPRWSETLRDRSHVVIRPMDSDDASLVIHELKL